MVVHSTPADKRFQSDLAHIRFRLRPFSLLDFVLSSALIVLVITIWYVGDFHAMHNGDSVIYPLASLYRPTAFVWEENHHGEIVALLTTVIRRPYWNLLAENALCSFAFLGGFAIWASLLIKRTSLTESSLWTALFVPLVLSKAMIFTTASSNGIRGVAMFLAGWFAYWLTTYLRDDARSSIWLYAAGLFALTFLTIYVYIGTLILVTVLVAGLFTSSLKAEFDLPQPRFSISVRAVVPAGCLAVAVLTYEWLEFTSPYKTIALLNAFTFANMPEALARLLSSWASSQLSAPGFALTLLIVFFIMLLMCGGRSTYIRKPLLAYFAFAALLEAVVAASSRWVAANAYGGWYLLLLTYLVALLAIVTASSLVRTASRYLARWRQHARSSPFATISSIKASSIHGAVLGMFFVLAGHVNAATWRAYSPADPISTIEHTIGKDTLDFVRAGCDVLLGDYWKIWPTVLTVNDYYYRNGTIDPHTQKLRMVAGLALRARPTEIIWRRMLTWPDVKLCAFVGDEAALRWALSTYAPDVSLRLLETRGGVAVYEVPVGDRYGRVQLQPDSPGYIEALEFEFDRPVPGSGWGGSEGEAGQTTFQWMTAKVATFYAPLASDRDANIQFRVVLAVTPDILEGLTLRVNSRPVALTRSADSGGAMIFEGTISQNIFAFDPGTTKLEFRIGRTASPALTGLNPADPRQLGVSFDWLRIGPAFSSSES